jgi:hypothetical protein
MNNEPTIEQMNEMIGIYMGGQWITKAIGGRERRWFYYNDLPFARVKSTIELNYHKSWDELMPVVKKIYDTLADMLKKRPPHTACHGDLIEVDIHCAIREVDILKAHGYVYQFCLWYNKQKEVNNDTN